jgi:TP901 family phage tail tape measure protein
MDQVDLQLRIATEKADAEMAASAKRARDLFEKRGFKLNIKGGELPLGRITGDFEKFQGSLDAATARVLAFTATTTVVYGLATAFTRLFTDSVKLEKQLAGIQAILQTSNSNLQKFSDELFKVANATGQSFDVAATAASEFARQGLSVEETLKATNAALAFSKIAGTDATQTVENLTAAINTFSNEALSYTDVIDTIVSLDNAFAISAAGISDGLKRVGSVASESGIQLKEIASLISVVQQVSARGAPVISNGLKTIFTRLGRSKVQESLNDIGVSTQDANGQFRSQIDILTDLSNKLDSLSDSQRAFILEQVAGVYQINTLQATLKSLNGEYSLFDKAVKVASDSSGNAAERLKILTDTTDANLQKLKNNVTQFLAETGKATVKPLLDNFVGIGNKIFDTLNLGSATKQGEEAGISIGTVLFNGLSSALSGPGTVLIIATVGKLLTKITKDAFSALQTLSGLKKASLVDSKTQASINEAIAQGNKSLVDRLATTTSIVEKTILLNKLLSEQSGKQSIAQISEAVSVGLAANKKILPPKGKTKAEGFIPTYYRGFIPQSMQRLEKKGAMAGGYSPKKVIAAPDSIGGVMNEAESVVGMRGMKQPFINPPKYSKAGRKHRKKSIEKIGIDPYALMSSDGFIPNFAKSKYNKDAKGELISIDYLNKVSGQQSSRVADGGVDNINNLKYNVISLNSPDYIKGIKEKLKGPFTEDKAKFVANIALKNGYSRNDTQKFIDNLREKGQVKPLPMPSSRLGRGLSLMTNFKNKIPDNPLNKKDKKNKLDTNIQDQINGFATNVGSKMFEKTGLRAFNKSSSEVFVLADDQNSRMDILDSNKKPIGEIKAGRITRDNLVSKAIESQALQLDREDERSSFPFYKNNNEEPISFEKPFTLVKRYKNSTAALPFSGNGFIPNFAEIIRKIGIIDGDALSQDIKKAKNEGGQESIVKKEMERLNMTKMWEYYEHLGNYALAKRKSGSLNKINAIFGRPGSGKTSLASNLDKYGNIKSSDNAKARKSTRKIILQESDIDKVDEIIATKASISTAEESLRSGFMGGVDRLYNLETSNKDRKKLATKRANENNEGVNLGRSKGELRGTINLPDDEGYIGQVGEQILGNKSVRIGQKLDKDGNIKRSRIKEKYNVQKRRIALAYGAFAPFTKGHEQMFTQARSLGFDPSNIVFAVSSGAQFKAGDAHSQRTSIFPADVRAKIIREATGAQTTKINSSNFRGTIPSILKLSDGSLVSPAPGSIALTGDDKGSAELGKYVKAGYQTVMGERSADVSGTKLREAIDAGDEEGIRRLAPKGSADYLIKNLGVISNRSKFLQKLAEKKQLEMEKKLSPIEAELATLPARVIKGKTPQEIADRVYELRKQRDKIKESTGISKTFSRATDLYKGLQFSDLSNNVKPNSKINADDESIDIGKFLPNNPNAQQQFSLSQARGNKNVEFDDKISTISFKQVEVKIPDKEGSRRNLMSSVLQSAPDSYRFKDKNRKGGKQSQNDYTGVFERYAIQQVNKTKIGPKFIPTRTTGFNKGNNAVDAFSIDSVKNKEISLLEAKAGDWTAPKVGDKYGRFLPENIVELSPMLLPLFTEGVKDEYDRIKLNNYVAVPDLNDIDPITRRQTNAGPLTELVNGKRVVTGIVKPDFRTKGSSSRSGSLPSTGDPLNDAINRMRGVKEVTSAPVTDEDKVQAYLAGLMNKKIKPRIGRGNSSGFIPNFAAPPQSPINLAYSPAHKARQKKEGGLRRRRQQVSALVETLITKLPQSYLSNKVLGDAVEGSGIETEGIFSNMARIPQFLASFGGPKAIDFVHQVEQKGMKVSQSLQKRLSRKVAKIVGPKYNADGFIPNFSPYIDRVMGLEQRMSGNSAVLDTKTGPFPFIRNKGQRNFKDAISDHGGLNNALSDSIAGQRSAGLMSGGFVPNFSVLGRGVDPSLRTPEQILARQERAKMIRTEREKVKLQDQMDRIRANRGRRNSGGNTGPDSPNLPDKESKMNSRLGALAALSFAIPTVTGMFSTTKEGVEPSKTQKITEGAGEAIGAGIAVATTVALIPALAPIAPIVGGAVFAYKALNSVLKANVPSVKDQVAANQNLITENEKSVNALNETVRAQEQLSQLQSSGADALKIAKAQIEFNKSLAKIQDKDLLNAFRNEKDPNKRENAILQFQERKRKETQFSESNTLFSQEAQKISQERSGIMNLFSQSPLPDFKSENYDQFLNPIIESLDLSKLSKDGLESLKSVSEGSISFESFLGTYGKELGLSNDQLKIFSKTLQTFRKSYSAKSLADLDKYAASSIDLNRTVESQVSNLSKVTSTVNLEKAFRKRLEDLTVNTSLQNAKKFATTESNSRIAANQSTIDENLGRFSPTDLIKRKTNVAREGLSNSFTEANTKLTRETFGKISALIPENLTPEKRDSIFQAATDVLAKGSDISLLTDAVKKSLGTENESNVVLEQISTLTEEVIRAIYLLKLDVEIGNRELSVIEMQNIKAEEERQNVEIGKASSGPGEPLKKPSVPLLVQPIVDNLKKQIEELETKVYNTGFTTPQGIEDADKLKDLQRELAKIESQDFQARKEAGLPTPDKDLDIRRLATIGQLDKNEAAARAVKPLLSKRSYDKTGTIKNDTVQPIIDLLEIGTPEAGAKALEQINELFKGAEGGDLEAFNRVLMLTSEITSKKPPPSQEELKKREQEQVPSNVAKLNEQAGIGAFADPLAKKAAEQNLVQKEKEYNEAIEAQKKLQQYQVTLKQARLQALKDKESGNFDNLAFYGSDNTYSGKTSGMGETGDIGFPTVISELSPYIKKAEEGTFSKDDISSLYELSDLNIKEGDKGKSDIILNFITEVKKLIEKGLLTVQEKALKDEETLQKELDAAKKIIEEKTNQLKSAQEAVATPRPIGEGAEAGVAKLTETASGTEKIVEKYGDSKNPDLKGIADRAKEAQQAQTELDQQTSDPDYLKRRKYLVSERLAQGQELTPEVMAKIDQELAAKAQAQIENANLVGQTYEAKPVTDTPVRPNFFTRETAPAAGFEGVYSGSALVNDYLVQQDRAITEFSSDLAIGKGRPGFGYGTNGKPAPKPGEGPRDYSFGDTKGTMDENPDFYNRMQDPGFLESNWDKIVYPWLSNDARNKKEENAPESAQTKIIKKAGENFKTPMGTKLGQAAMVKTLAELPAIYEGSKKTPDEKDSEAQKRYVEQFLYLAQKGKSDGTPYSAEELKDIEDFTGQTLETRSAPGRGAIADLLKSSLTEASAAIPKPSVSDFLTGKEGGPSGKENTYAQRLKEETIKIARAKLAQGKPVSAFTDANNKVITQYEPYTEEEKKVFEASLLEDETVPNMSKGDRAIYDAEQKRDRLKATAGYMRAQTPEQDQMSTLEWLQIAATGSAPEKAGQETKPWVIPNQTRNNTMGSSYGKVSDLFRNIEGATNFATSADSEDVYSMNETEDEKNKRLALKAQRDEANRKLQETLSNPQTIESIRRSSQDGQIRPEIINSPQVNEEGKALLKRFNTIKQDTQTVEEQIASVGEKGLAESVRYRIGLGQNIRSKTGDDRVFEDTLFGREISELNNFRKNRESGKTDAQGFKGEEVDPSDRMSILRRVNKKDWSEIDSVPTPDLLKAIDDVIGQYTRTATSPKVLEERGKILSQYESGAIGLDDPSLKRSGLLKELTDLAGGLDALRNFSGSKGDFQQAKDLTDQLVKLKASENEIIGQVSELLQKLNDSIPAQTPPATTTETPPATTTPPSASNTSTTETKVVTANINVSINGDSINDKQLSQLTAYIDRSVSSSIRESAISTNSSIPSLGPPRSSPSSSTLLA